MAGGDILTDAISADSASRSPISDTDVPYVDEFGSGFNEAFGWVGAVLAQGEYEHQNVITPDAYNPNTLQFTITESQSAYNSAIGRRARARGRYGIFRGSGGANSVTVKSNNSYCLHVVAIARMYERMTLLKKNSLEVVHQQYVQSRLLTEDGQKELLVQYGDHIIHGVIPGRELLVDFRFETTSSSQMRQLSAEISGSVSNVNSGSASYSQMIGSAQSYKSSSVFVTGLDGSTLAREQDINMVHDLIRDFFNDNDSPLEAKFYKTIPINQVYLGENPLRWGSQRSLENRLVVSNYLIDSMEYLTDAEADALYVQDNPTEFDSGERERAEADLEKIILARAFLDGKGRSVREDFVDSYRSPEPLLLIPSIISAMPTLDPYVRVEPSPAPMRTRPTPIQNRSNRTADDNPGIGGGGGH